MKFRKIEEEEGFVVVKQRLDIIQPNVKQFDSNNG